MTIYVDKIKCPQDHPCPAVAVCPMDAMTQEGNDAPTVDDILCIDCGACVGACPTGALQSR